MALESFPSVPLQRAAATVGAPPAPVKVFTVQHQGVGNVAYENWCWLAVAVSVAAYYDPATQFTQCSLANELINTGCDCCDIGNQGACDDPAGGTLLQSLGAEGTNNLKGDPVDLTAPDTDIVQLKSQIASEVSGEHPVCLRIEWQNNSGGHFIGVSRTYIDNGAMYLSISDPLNAPGNYPVNTLLSDGYGDLLQNPLYGSWTHTYFTQGAP